jgi:hypothetical protein
VLNIEGTLSGLLVNQNIGATTNITGNLALSGTRDIANQAGAVLNVNSGAAVTNVAKLDNDRADSNINLLGAGSSIAANDFENDGTTTIAANANITTVTTVLNNTGATVVLQGAAAATLAAGTSLTNDGTITGGANSSVTAGTALINTGTITAADGASVASSGTVANNAGSISLNGTGASLSAGTTLDNLALITVAGDNALVAASGDITNSGTVNVTGSNATFGSDTSLLNTGAITAAQDTLVYSLGSLSNNAGTIDLDGSGATLRADTTLDNAATINVAGGATINVLGAMTNSGTINLEGVASNISALTFANTSLVDVTSGGATITALMTNSAGGIVRIGGSPTGASLTLTGSLNSTGGTIDMQDGDFPDISGVATPADPTPGIAGLDTFTVTGNLTGGTVLYDLNVTNAYPTASNNVLIGDTLQVNGTATGPITLSFAANDNTQNLGLDGTGGISVADNTYTVVVGTLLDVGDFAFAADNLQGGAAALSGPLVVYSLLNNGSGGIDMTRELNPVLAALASNVSTVQALIGSVINRPSSPFVSGLAYEDDDNKGTGLWTRIQGGSAEATARTNNGTSNDPYTVTADFAGLQAGYDFGQFDAATGGWDVAGGVVFGFNSGESEQAVVDPTTSDSITRTDFDQTFLGGYVAFANGPWSGDVQLRFDQTDFELNNSNPLNGITGEKTDSNGTTLSASVSYSIPVSDAWTIVPTGGFALTQTETDLVNIRDSSSGAVLGTLSFPDHLTSIAFAGVTAANTVIGAQGDSAFSRFVTATVYNDFSDERESIVTLGGGTGNAISQFTENLGTFGEVSLGLSYIKILDGQVGSAKQLNASVRLDTRFSDQVDATSITAQVRLQF